MTEKEKEKIKDIIKQLEDAAIPHEDGCNYYEWDPVHKVIDELRKLLQE